MLRMSGGDDVRTHGVDGFVSNTVNHPYVPLNDSVWEMGVSADPKDKASKDFKKRSEDQSDLIKSNTTYVAVTPHVWIDKNKWIEAGRETGVWKDVTVIDGAVLSEWIDQSPGVAIWFHAIAGTPIADVDDLDRAWNKLVEMPLQRTIPPSLVLGGRTDAGEKLSAWMKSPSGEYRIAGESADEVELFVLAAAKQSVAKGVDNTAPFLSIRSKEALHYLHELQTAHIVFVRDTDLADDVRASGVRHLFLVCQESAPIPNIKPLPTLDRNVVEKELQQMGFSEFDARRISGESKGSVVALLWSMGSSSVVRSAWLQDPIASKLAPLVLAGSWHSQSATDQEAVARLAGCPYQQIETLIGHWRAPEYPLVRWGNNWSWRAWRVAWERLAGRFSDDLLSRFADVVIEVLSAKHSSDTSTRYRHWRGRGFGSSEEYSEELREGLVRSLAKLGSLSSEHGNFDGQRLASGVVRSLLDIDSGGETLLSLSRHLPDLAEAAPDVFMSCVDKLIRNPDLQRALFAENNGFGGNRYCSLLWALEGLAWNPEYLSMVLLLLGHLDACDPGGSLSNRPKASLRAILLPWYPGTSATVSQRLAAFDTLAEKIPEVAWSSGLTLLPHGHETVTPTARPRFRNWMLHDHPTVTIVDHATYVEKLIDKLLAMAGTDHGRWMQFIGYISVLAVYSPKRVDEVVATLQSNKNDVWTQGQRAQFGEAVRLLAFRYEQRENNDDDKSTTAQLLRKITSQFVPERLEDQYGWLFSDSFRVHFRKGASYEERRNEIEKERIAAVEQVRSNGGIVRLLAWADEVDDPSILGDILGKQLLSEAEVIEIVNACFADRANINPSSRRHKCGNGFVSRYALRYGNEWASEMLQSIFRSHGLMPAAAFAIAIESFQQLWQKATEVSAELSHLYWRNISIWRLREALARSAIPYLLANNRNYAAVELVSQLLPSLTETSVVDSDVLSLCVEVLRVVPSHALENEPCLSDANWFQYPVEQVFEYVERFSDQRDTRDLLMRWEWLLFDKFLYGPGRGLKILNEEMSQSSEFFVNVMKLAHLDDASVMSSLRMDGVCNPRTAVSHGLSLLMRWCIVPGEVAADTKVLTEEVDIDRNYPASLAISGTVDARRLREWVSSSRELSAKAELLDQCDCYLGQVFASSPADPDGTWPCRAVRDEIEKLASEAVERRFAMTTLNKRGMHGVGKTGVAERTIASVFNKWASAYASTHPRTATALRQVAEHYVTEGKARDREGLLNEFED